MAMPTVSLLPPRVAAGCSSALNTHIPPAVHRPPHRSSTGTASRTPLVGSLVRLRRTRVEHQLGPKARPWAPVAIHGNTGDVPKQAL